MYCEHDFLDRFHAAAEDGFTAVELTFPYEFKPVEIAAAARAAGTKIIGLNTPAGELVPGKKRGIAAIPGKEAEYLDMIKQGIEYAQELGAPRVLTLASMVDDNDLFAPMMVQFMVNLNAAAALCAEAGLTLLIEAHNRVEHSGYLLQTIDQCREIIETVQAPNLKCLFDFFHTQINEGDVTHRFLQHLNLIDHVQIGDNPGRHEPGTGELNYPYVFQTIADSKYHGWVAGEYFPSTEKTPDSHRWMPECNVRPS